MAYNGLFGHGAVDTSVNGKWLYPKICVNHKRELSEISKLREHFDESIAYS